MLGFQGNMFLPTYNSMTLGHSPLYNPGVLTGNPRKTVGNEISQSAKRSKRDQTSASDTESDTDNDSFARRRSQNDVDQDGSEVQRVKGPWTSQEDRKLKELVAEFGPRWSVIAERLPGRIGKQCRERWLNHLDDKIKRSPWTPQEDAILLEAHKTKGNRWCQIAKLLPGRPENSVKNRYTSLAHKHAKAQGFTLPSYCPPSDRSSPPPLSDSQSDSSSETHSTGE